MRCRLSSTESASETTGVQSKVMSGAARMQTQAITWIAMNQGIAPNAQGNRLRGSLRNPS